MNINKYTPLVICVVIGFLIMIYTLCTCNIVEKFEFSEGELCSTCEDRVWCSGYGGFCNTCPANANETRDGGGNFYCGDKTCEYIGDDSFFEKKGCVDENNEINLCSACEDKVWCSGYGDFVILVLLMRMKQETAEVIFIVVIKLVNI